jgi:phosphatidylinositol alpha-1,6-mannosyltransferase
MERRGALTLLSVCRLIPEKGIDVVLEALSVLAGRGLRPQYIVIGDGPDRGRLQGLVDKLGLSGQVEFWGQVQDHILEQAYAQATAFVLMSRPGDRVEGLGLVLLEAQARGIPVVTSRSMGIPEAVGDAAVLIDEFTSPDRVADAIAMVLSDPVRRSELARRGKERADGLTPEVMATRLLTMARERGCLA